MQKLSTLFFIWSASITLLVPPLSFVLGRILNPLTAWQPHGLLQRTCLCAGVAVTAGLAAAVRRYGRHLQGLELTFGQILCAVLFALAVALPRLTALAPDLPVAVYDDSWHMQKAVSVMGSFPHLRHYLFPDLSFSYYFYAYSIPAALYSTAPGLNLKLIWALYVLCVSCSVTALLCICGNALVPRETGQRLFFTLCITFLGGLHEWPHFMASLLHGRPNWHTEWWARGIGLEQQVSSLYSTHFWAPQHACGLALFAVQFAVLRRCGPSTAAALLCGLLAGIQAGFSAYTALFACLYCLLALFRRALNNIRKALAAAVWFSAGALAALLPAAGCIAGRSAPLAWVADIQDLPAYVLFLAVEFGVVLLLFCMYVYARRRQSDRQALTDASFVLLTFVLLFCFHSSGYNVLSYRSMLPAQLVIILGAAAALEHLAGAKRFLKSAAVVLLCLQMTGFLPEMLAMTKKHIDVKRAGMRLPETVVRVNMSGPVDEAYDIPYRQDVSEAAFDIMTLNLFRMKNVDRRYFCSGRIGANNLVYLDDEGVEELKKGCRHPVMQ